MACLERDVEPYLDMAIKIRYWDCPSDHEDFRKIINTIEASQDICDIPRLLEELYKAGYIIKNI